MSSRKPTPAKNLVVVTSAMVAAAAAAAAANPKAAKSKVDKKSTIVEKAPAKEAEAKSDIAPKIAPTSGDNKRKFEGASSFHAPPKQKRVYRSVNKLGVNEKDVDDLPEEQKVCFRNLRFHYNLTETVENKVVNCKDCDRSERKCVQLHYEQLERKKYSKQDVLDQVVPQSNKKKRKNREVLAEAIRNDAKLK